MNKFNLKPLKEDKRDILVGSLFSLPKLKDLPESFIISPSPIKQQAGTDYCYAFASCAVSEDQEGVVLDPLYTVFKTKQIEGNEDWGADIRDAASSHCKFGALEQSMSPYTIDTPRATIMDKTSWTSLQDTNAFQHTKESYAQVTGPYDFFDNIRATIYYFRLEKRSVLMGLTWCAEWLNSPDGVIDHVGSQLGGHAIKICGYTKRNGTMYLVGQLSSGEEVGAKGIFLFSREVINATGPIYGALTFLDYPKTQLKAHQDLGVKIDSAMIVKLIQLVLGLIIKYFKKQ